jgi:integrase/recombinase XerD
VTRLKKMMLEELQLRNYAQNTVRHYLRAVKDFARHFNCSPDRLGPRHIREYQAELSEKRKLSGIPQNNTWRRCASSTTILSREEVAQLLHAARTPGERILLMTLYATVARNSELTHLKVSDIDSQRMVVHIRGGKGR